MRCDICREPVSRERAEAFSDLGVDWALCPRCQGMETPPDEDMHHSRAPR